MKKRGIVILVSCGILLGMATLPTEASYAHNSKHAHKWHPIYDQSIDPAAPKHSIWLLVNPRAKDCAVMVRMVQNGSLAPEAVYDPAAPCVRLGFVK